MASLRLLLLLLVVTGSAADTEASSTAALTPLRSLLSQRKSTAAAVGVGGRRLGCKSGDCRTCVAACGYTCLMTHSCNGKCGGHRHNPHCHKPVPTPSPTVACTVTGLKGRWKFLSTVLGTQTYTVTVGTSHTNGEEASSTETQSVGTDFEVGFGNAFGGGNDFFSIGGSSSASFSTSVVNEVAETFTSSNSRTQSKDNTRSIEFADAYQNFELFIFEFEVERSRGKVAAEDDGCPDFITTTEHYAVANKRDQPPCCVPGHCADKPVRRPQAFFLNVKCSAPHKHPRPRRTKRSLLLRRRPRCNWCHKEEHVVLFDERGVPAAHCRVGEPSCEAKSVALPDDKFVSAPELVAGQHEVLCPDGYDGKVLVDCKMGEVSVVGSNCEKQTKEDAAPTPPPTALENPDCPSKVFEVDGGAAFLKAHPMLFGETLIDCPDGYDGQIAVECTKATSLISKLGGKCTEAAPPAPTIPPTIPPTQPAPTVALGCKSKVIVLEDTGEMVKAPAMAPGEENVLECDHGKLAVECRATGSVIMVTSSTCFPTERPTATHGGLHHEEIAGAKRSSYRGVALALSAASALFLGML